MSERPRIDISVDAVVFGYRSGDGIAVLLIRRKNAPFKGKWALPGGFVDADESLEAAAVRELKEETGITVNALRQLYTFGHPRRDPRKRVVSVAHYALVKRDIFKLEAADDADDARWFSIARLPALAFDHRKILDMAILRLRNTIMHEPVGMELLGRSFPFSGLHKLYEALYGRKIDRRNFRKKVLALGMLRQLKQRKAGSRGRPGTLYAFSKKGYLQLKAKGILPLVR